MKSKYKYIIYILLLVIFNFLLFYNFKELKKEKKIQIIRKEIINQEPIKKELPTIDFVSIRKKYKNNDITAAIRIVNTKFEEIIFQGKDNKYYLNHSYNHKKGSGEIFVDYRNKIDEGNVKYLYISGFKKSNELINYFEKNKCNSLIEVETDKKIYKYELVTIYNKKIVYNKIDYNNINSKSLCSSVKEEDELLIINNEKGKKVTNIIMRKVK